jgi:hypothetical protein
VDANSKKSIHFKETLPSTLDTIQKDDEELRITFLRASLKKYFEVISNPLPIINESIKSLASFIDNIDPSIDSEGFASSLNTSEDVPLDSEIFEFGETDRERKKVLQGLSKFSVEKESLQDDRILLMTSKEGRKRAVERVKQLEKDKLELEKRKTSLDIVLEYHREKVILSFII